MDALADALQHELQVQYTPNCRISISTPRLILRSAEWADMPRLASIKTLREVNKTHFYGQPTREQCLPSFWHYIKSNIPRYTGRLDTPSRRPSYWLFAIQPKQGSDIQAKGSLDAEGYIGSIGAVINGPLGVYFAANEDYEALEPPSHPDMKDSSADLFYELHPGFWRQGIMKEAMRRVVQFFFEELGIGSILVDPLATNVASIRLCESLGYWVKTGTKFGDVGVSGGRKQIVFTVNRDHWLKNGYGTDGYEERKERKIVCHWCCNFMVEAKSRCAKCQQVWYCGRECQVASWKRGHKRQCGAA